MSAAAPVGASQAVYHPGRRVLSVVDAIDRHIALVRHDETLFDGQGEPIVPLAVTAASEASVAAAWFDLIAAPCLSLDDVRAKAGYVLSDPIGYRATPLTDLLGPDGSDTLAPDNCLPLFLESLLGWPLKTSAGSAPGPAAGAAS